MHLVFGTPFSCAAIVCLKTNRRLEWWMTLINEKWSIAVFGVLNFS